MTLYSPIGYGFDEILSSPQLTGSRLPTEITFPIPQTPQKWIIGKNSYISIKLNITMTDEAGVVGPLRPIVNDGTRIAPTAISIPFLSVNPAICFFNNAICNVDTKQISLIPELQQTNTLYRLLFESTTENKTVNAQNGLTPPNIDDVDTNLGIYTDIFKISKKINPDAGNTGITPDLSTKLTKHMIWALKNQQFNFDNSTCKFLLVYFTPKSRFSSVRVENLFYVYQLILCMRKT